MPTVSLFFGTGMFVILTLLGVIFKDIDYMVLITLMVITYLVATIKSDLYKRVYTNLTTVF